MMCYVTGLPEAGKLIGVKSQGEVKPITYFCSK